MNDQLTYVLITPYSLLKSRTGGIIGRLLAHSRLELVGARMCVFSDAFLKEYKDMVVPVGADDRLRQALRRYVAESLGQKNPWGYVPRCLVLLFRGPDAVRHLHHDVIGLYTERAVGDTVRGTYGDFLSDTDGRIRHFEPAVLNCPDPELNTRHLQLLEKYVTADGGVLAGRLDYSEPDVQVSLVLIKPDNFERRSRRPGNIIDAFSLTGLRIVGAKLFNMTVAQGMEFYGPLEAIFVKRLKGNVTQEVYHRLHDAFGFPFTMADAQAMADMLAERNAATEFHRIVEYMTGINPEDVTDPAQRATASRAKCLALLYEGPKAIEKIRSVLGSTDPTKAEPGTIRSDFGRDLMRNGAHASDSPQSAIRERKIVSLSGEPENTCDLAEIIREYLARQ
jgi:nucleoside diphosphate kinase